jgi:hypothetical protein
VSGFWQNQRLDDEEVQRQPWGSWARRMRKQKGWENRWNGRTMKRRIWEIRWSFHIFISSNKRRLPLDMKHPACYMKWPWNLRWSISDVKRENI